ncbi:hypothetical protein P154DRAFT_517384 [Amniculicola lignicola CBS 123094]|uniref:CFEM domain-containing protein n=1 Tax=Amniculicola lignicola CBS 123094 TaxID=1392246 RepID=A0A6A5WZ08_9PLEO|nr:hypothetical protein P154DRAFT_517384 [Amniculicola lignicola CBS 123094]
MKNSIALLVSGLAAQQVAATWDRYAPKFKSPQYNNNECSDKQKGGFDWQDIPTGAVPSYGDFNFGGGAGGWTCSNRFGKRDELTKRTFNSKCIKNKVKKEQPASFDCTKRKEGFSVKEIEVSVEFDCNLEFHYKMPDKSICKHVAPCKKDGTVVQNTQCGGAESVDVYLGDHDEPDKEDCEIGFHRIDFDCNPGYTPPVKTSDVPQTSSPPASTPPAESSSAVESSAVPESSAPPTPESSTPASYTTPPPDSYTPPASTPGIYSNSSIAVPSSTAEVPEYTPSSVVEVPSSTTSSPENTPPAEESPSSDIPEYTPSSTPETPGSTTPPAGESPSTTSSPESTPPVVESPSSTPETPVYTPGSSAPESSEGTPSTTASPSSTPVTPYTPPNVLPQCMNTWLEVQTECKDNTDVQCYCKNADFTKNVIDCVSAWSTNEQIQEALQYLIGICASYVPQNPGIITNCPSNVPINPTTTPAAPPPASTEVVPSYGVSSETPAEPSYVASSGIPTAGYTVPAETTAAPTADVPSAGPPAGPVTTITYKTTLTVPCSTGGYTTSTVDTSVTVPQVVFTTQTPTNPPAGGATPTEPVELIPGTPAPAPAYTTAPPYPIPSSAGLPTTIGTAVIPGTNGTATSTQPAQFTGAASSVTISFAPAVFGAVLAFLAL